MNMAVEQLTAGMARQAGLKSQAFAHAGYHLPGIANFQNTGWTILLINQHTLGDNYTSMNGDHSPAANTLEALHIRS